MLALAIAACASLLAGAPRPSPAANAHINSTAHAHSPLSESRTTATMTMAAHITMHTIARRTTALNCTLHLIPARMPDCLLDGTIDGVMTIPTMAAFPRPAAATRSTPRTKSPLQPRAQPPSFCTRHALLQSSPDLEPHACPPAPPIWMDRPCNPPHAATRIPHIPHNPDGLVPDGGPPRLRRETLSTISDHSPPLSTHSSAAPDATRHPHGHRRPGALHVRRPPGRPQILLHRPDPPDHPPTRVHPRVQPRPHRHLTLPRHSSPPSPAPSSASKHGAKSKQRRQPVAGKGWRPQAPPDLPPRPPDRGARRRMTPP